MVELVRRCLLLLVLVILAVALDLLAFLAAAIWIRITT
jgi:hypothetical protein